MCADNSREVHFFKAAEPLFERFGFRKTTIEEICKAAGSSKRTFYELFTDKGEFFVKMFMHVASDEVLSWHKDLPQDLDPRMKLESYLDKYVEAGRTHPIFNLCLVESEIHECMHKYSRTVTFQPMIEALSGIIAEGVADHTFRRVDPETVVWIINTLMDSVYYILPQMTGKPGAFQNKRLAVETRALIINGLLA